VHALSVTSTQLTLHLLDLARRHGAPLSDMSVRPVSSAEVPWSRVERLRRPFETEYRGPAEALEASWHAFMSLCCVLFHLPMPTGAEVRERAQVALCREVEYDLVLAAGEERWEYYVPGRQSVRVVLSPRGGRWYRGGEPCDPVEAVIESLEDLP
jgi:hypothetical protein